MLESNNYIKCSSCNVLVNNMVHHISYCTGAKPPTLNLHKIGSKVDLKCEKGVWTCSIDMPNITIKGVTKSGTALKSVKAIKKYIVSLIEDVENLEKILKG